MPLIPLLRSLNPWQSLFQHTSKNPSDYPDITQMRNMSGTAKDTANSGIGEDATANIGSEGATANANTTIPLFSPPGNDLRMDWGNTCSLGCLPDLTQYSHPTRCKTSSVGQSTGLLILRSSVRFRQKLKKPRTQIYMDLSYIDPLARVLNYCYK